MAVMESVFQRCRDIGIDVDRIELTRDEAQIKYCVGDECFILDCNVSPGGWRSSGVNLAADWWTIVRPEVKVYLDGELVPSNLIVMQSNLVWSSEDDGPTIYAHDGPGRIYWIDAGGVYAVEAITGLLGSSYAVVSPAHLTDGAKAYYRELITVRRTWHWALPPHSHDSASLEGKLSITDSLSVLRAHAGAAATWLRRVLPHYKVGAPSVDDVRAKLELESRLRVEESVTGSLRPLAFTLEAIEDATFAWPGLWMISGRAPDIRKDFAVLLAWDAVLAAVAAASRLHADYKPGLVYGPKLSQLVTRRERRFSKRDDGVVSSLYVQINPTRIAGDASVVAARLLQAATHELTHLWLGEYEPHSELFAFRREHLLSATLELMPHVVELVEKLGLHMRPGRPTPIPPVTLTQWLHEQLIRSETVTTRQLVAGWAAVRNLTEGRAQREVEDALEEATCCGFCFWQARDTTVKSLLRPA